MDTEMVTNSFSKTPKLDRSSIRSTREVPFAMTTAGFIVPMISGFLSASSSGLIIYIICRSQQKFSTTYHRIMTFMSIFDIISSLCIALGTIMMPSDNVFPFKGPTLGNHATCQGQGWLIMFGQIGAAAMNASLAWYFVCRIAFKIGYAKIRKRIEPCMYIYTTMVSLFVPTVFLVNDLLNSTPYDNFCNIGPHVLSCQELIGSEYNEWMSVCDMGKGDEEAYKKYFPTIVLALLLQFILIVLGMAIIIWTVYKNMKDIKAFLNDDKRQDTNDQHVNEDQNDPEQDSCSKRQALSHTKFNRVLIFQALMYILAFILTWSLNALSGILRISNFTLDSINSVIFPLQGLWNLLTFLYDKSYLIRQTNTEITCFQAVRQIITLPLGTPVLYLSNISTVAVDHRETEPKEEPPPIAFDDISKLRGDLSVLPSNYNSSELISIASTVLSQERVARTNMVNNRKSLKQMRLDDSEKNEQRTENPSMMADVESPNNASEFDNISKLSGVLSALPSNSD